MQADRIVLLILLVLVGVRVPLFLFTRFSYLERKQQHQFHLSEGQPPSRVPVSLPGGPSWSRGAHRHLGSPSSSHGDTKHQVMDVTQAMHELMKDEDDSMDQYDPSDTREDFIVTAADYLSEEVVARPDRSQVGASHALSRRAERMVSVMCPETDRERAQDAAPEGEGGREAGAAGNGGDDRLVPQADERAAVASEPAIQLAWLCHYPSRAGKEIETITREELNDNLIVRLGDLSVEYQFPKALLPLLPEREPKFNFSKCAIVGNSGEAKRARTAATSAMHPANVAGGSRSRSLEGTRPRNRQQRRSLQDEHGPDSRFRAARGEQDDISSCQLSQPS
eukprot:scaffold5884_cov403-Prasinococcus_capsulatus_cf.AAC.2